MDSRWQTENGAIARRWTETGEALRRKPLWMLNMLDMQSGYLPPTPDFASHSPFGGPSWFEYHPTIDVSE
jgi:hypothetical protein